MINFICTGCRNRRHEQCEGGSWCDCQHRSNARVAKDNTEEVDQPVTTAT